MKQTRQILVWAGLAVLLALVALLIGRVMRSEKTVQPGSKVARKALTHQTLPSKVVWKKGQKPAQVKPPLAVSESEEDEDDHRSPEERKLAKDIETAYDKEDFELAKACAPLALKCKDKEIRQSMVDALTWFDEKALPELTPFIADPDEEVAESAFNGWSTIVSGMDNDSEKIGLVEAAMQILSNEDHLDSISSEYIGVDEKLAVESLLRIIEGGGNERGVAKAKETYEFVTGDSFTDRAAAEKWVAEEYQPQDGVQK